MTSVAGSRDFSEICCPLWFAEAPELKHLDEKPSGDWGTVSVLKRDKIGRIATNYLTPKEFLFTIERSTGDLYGIQHAEIVDGVKQIVVDSRAVVAIKSAAIFLGTPFYLFGMVFVNLVKIAVDISAIFWRTLPGLVRDFQNKGILSALGNMAMDVVWHIPHEVAQDIWRVVRSPMYAAGMMLAAAYGVIQPFEGRKWMGEIELNWHQGAPYQQDLRYGLSEKDYLKISFSEMVKNIWSGKVYYLGYCMQKRGNIEDKVNGVARFRLFDKEPKKAETSPKPLDDEGMQYTFEVEYNGNVQSIEVEKRGDVAWPRHFSLIFSEMPNDACTKQFVEDVKSGLGTDDFPAGSIDSFLGNSMTDRMTSKAEHKVETLEGEKHHTLSVKYNRAQQIIKILEKGDGTFQIQACELNPDKFPSLDAKEHFIKDMKEIVGEKDLWVKSRDKSSLQKIFQDGQMGRLANLKYQLTNH